MMMMFSVFFFTRMKDKEREKDYFNINTNKYANVMVNKKLLSLIYLIATIVTKMFIIKMRSRQYFIFWHEV